MNERNKTEHRWKAIKLIEYYRKIKELNFMGNKTKRNRRNEMENEDSLYGRNKYA